MVVVVMRDLQRSVIEIFHAITVEDLPAVPDLHFRVVPTITLHSRLVRENLDFYHRLLRQKVAPAIWSFPFLEHGAAATVLFMEHKHPITVKFLVPLDVPSFLALLVNGNLPIDVDRLLERNLA